MNKIKSVFVGALAALLLSSGCTQRSAPAVEPVNKTAASDGYYYEQTQHDATRLSIVIVKHKSYEEVGQAWRELSGKSSVNKTGLRVVAFAYWAKNKVNGVMSCTIHMVDPALNYKPHYIGHELVHCMKGDFHPTQGR